MIGRVVQLVGGLVLFGTGLWLGLQAALGVGPWDVLHGGLSERLGTPFGLTSIAVGVVVLLLAVWSGVRAGLGTVLNVIVVGSVIDLLLAMPVLDGLDDGPLAVRLPLVVLGILVVAAGSALYLGAHLGPGPRDGLMVAIAQRTGWSVGTSRGVLECTVLLLGVLLGGPVGPGTVVFALGIGPAVQLALRVLRQTPARLPVPA